jgi:hypothetical protein
MATTTTTTNKPLNPRAQDLSPKGYNRNAFALNLDGASWAEVHDNASLDITDAITLEAWVYWDGAANKGILGRWHSDSNNATIYFISKAIQT